MASLKAEKEGRIGTTRDGSMRSTLSGVAGFEGGGLRPRAVECEQALATGKAVETDSPPGPPEAQNPADTLSLAW